jgi:hypothetical protein
MPAAFYTPAAMKNPARLFALAVCCAALFPACGKKDAEVTAEAEKALPPEEQMPAPAAEEPAAKTLADDANANANFEAWFKKHGLDLADPNMLDADADGDGFSNRDEFLADSNPKDPDSRPGIHKTIRLKEYTEVRLPFVVREVAGEVATIEFQGEGTPAREKVRKGDAIRGTKLKIDRVETRLDTDKHGERVDMSQIVMTDSDTGDRVVALKDLPTRTSASFATLTDAEGKTTLKVREGEVFSWPDEPGVSYKVIDLRMDQIVVKDEQSGKTVTIPRP